MVRQVSHINAYLLPDGPEVVVEASETNLAGLPPMVFGSMPRDGGQLLLEPSERSAMVSAHPEAARFIRRYMGAAEWIRGTTRYCLWISDEDIAEAAAIPPIRQRLERVRSVRMASKAASTKKFAGLPHRFVQCAHLETSSIMVPSVSSERRDYIPMGFLDQNTVISNLANAIYHAEPWVFALIQSRMHMVWVRAVAGRLESRLRYSALLVYNTFPTPHLLGSAKDSLTQHVYAILEAREQFAGKTLAELYDPENMPGALRGVHQRLDETVDKLYQKSEFSSDEERLELLFEMYKDIIAAKQGALSLA